MITVGTKIKCTLYSLASKYGAMSATYIHSEPQPWEGEREGITSMSQTQSQLICSAVAAEGGGERG